MPTFREMLATAKAKSPFAGGLALGLCLLSVVLTSIATITYPHYPEVFSNGFLEVSVPLLTSGFLPRTLLGMSGAGWTVAWLLYFAGWATVLGWLLLRGATGAPARAIAGGTFAAGICLLWMVGHYPTPEKDATLKFIEQSYRAE